MERRAIDTRNLATRQSILASEREQHNAPAAAQLSAGRADRVLGLDRPSAPRGPRATRRFAQRGVACRALGLRRARNRLSSALFGLIPLVLSISQLVSPLSLSLSLSLSLADRAQGPGTGRGGAAGEEGAQLREEKELQVRHCRRLVCGTRLGEVSVLFYVAHHLDKAGFIAICIPMRLHSNLAPISRIMQNADESKRIWTCQVAHVFASRARVIPFVVVCSAIWGNLS